MDERQDEQTTRSDSSSCDPKAAALELYDRGVLLFSEGEPDKALAVFEEAIRLDPACAPAYNGQGCVLLAQDKPDAALIAFNESIRIEPDFCKPYANRGAIYDQRGQYDLALADYNKAIELEPTFIIAIRNRGLLYYETQRDEEAISDFSSFLEVDKSDAIVFESRGKCHHRIGDVEKAVKDFSEAILIDSKNAILYCRRGDSLYDLKRYEEAIDDYTAGIEIDPGNASVFAMRGSAHQHLRNFDDSLDDLDHAIKLDPSNAWAFFCRGTTYHSIGDYDNAISDYDESIRLDPKDPRVYVNRGHAFHELEEYDKALCDYNQAISIEPDHAEAYYRRAMLRLEKEEWQKAVDDLNIAIKNDPTHKAAYRKRAEAWDELEEPDNAVRDYNRADELEEEKSSQGNNMSNRKKTTFHLLEKHFSPTPLDDITITERQFPARVRADLQRAIDSQVSRQAKLLHFCGVRKQFQHQGMNFSELIIRDHREPAISVPPQYEEIDIGEEETVKCLKDGLWLLERNGQKFALFLEPPTQIGRAQGLRIQLATVNNEAGTEISDTFFKQLETAIFESTCYRGKTISLQEHKHYSGVSTAICVHKMKTVEREQVILPAKTLELLERNVIKFVAQRGRLYELGISTKKGLLFYGPPGTGKTHTIQFLSNELESHTTLLISSEQVGLLGEYMTLARLLQPSIVVIEDVDLIARNRTEMHSPCEEALLNKLLNEMDGLQQDADILFILTTNRPEKLEAALASRPGRIDQAIEFPLPDDEGRAKLIRLYSYGVSLSNEVIEATVKKTEGVSAAFIKELLRRAMQFHLEREDSATIEIQDVENAIEELLFSGGSLNRKLLGAKIDE